MYGVNIGYFISPESHEDTRARRHYTFAKVDGIIFELYDDAYVKVSLCEPTEFVGLPLFVCMPNYTFFFILFRLKMVRQIISAVLWNCLKVWMEKHTSLHSGSSGLKTL